MPVAREFAVEIQPAASRASFVEVRRHVVVQLRFTPVDTWLLEPSDVVW